MFGQKDASACKTWLEATHPALFTQVYGEDAGTGAGAAEPTGEGAAAGGAPGDKPAEESKGDNPPEQVKPKKASAKDGIINVYKLKRGGKKILCVIKGMEYYTKDLKGLASKFRKKFSCGADVAKDDIYGECIQVQGDVEERLLDYLEEDKDMIKLEIPSEKVHFEEKGNKKGRKKVDKV